MRPLRPKLSDGDTVEVLTSAAQTPRKDWLEFVVSGKARSRIRHAIRAAENARSRELGRGVGSSRRICTTSMRVSPRNGRQNARS